MSHGRGPLDLTAAEAAQLCGVLADGLAVRVRRDGVRPTPRMVELLAELQRAAQRPTPKPQADIAHEPPAFEPLTVAEVAARMGCSPQWVRRLVAAGRLPGRRTPAGWIIHWGPPVSDPKPDRRAP